MDRFNWKSESKCGKDPEMPAILRSGLWDPFFDEKEEQDKAWIKAYCADCPVKIECQGAGHDEHGAWGGIPSRSRRYQNSLNESKILEFLAQTKIQSQDTPSVPSEVREDDCA